MMIMFVCLFSQTSFLATILISQFISAAWHVSASSPDHMQTTTKIFGPSSLFTYGESESCSKTSSKLLISMIMSLFPMRPFGALEWDILLGGLCGNFVKVPREGALVALLAHRLWWNYFFTLQIIVDLLIIRYLTTPIERYNIPGGNDNSQN